MPPTTTRRNADHAPTRRRLLTGGAVTGAAIALAGCSGAGTDTPAPSADAAASSRAARRRESAELLARYDATTAEHPDLAARLRPLRQQVARHTTALGGLDAGSAPPSAGATSSPSAGAADPSSSAAPSAAPRVPKTAKAALAALAAAERRAARSRASALVDAPPELARLLASLAGCAAAHAQLLGADQS